MIFIILYLLSFPIILYDNYFSVRTIAEKSKITRKPSFFVIVHVIIYGSIIGLWFKYNWKVALITFIISWTFNKYSFRFFFHKYIDEKTKEFINSDWFETELPIEDRLRKAREFAKALALRNATGSGLE